MTEIDALKAEVARLMAENAKPGSNRHVAWVSGWAQGCEEVRHILEPKLKDLIEAASAHDADPSVENYLLLRAALSRAKGE